MYTKKIIIAVVAFLAMTNISFSQDKSNVYRYDPKAQKYAGEWLWENGNNSLLLTLKFDRINVNYTGREPIKIDAVYGFHKLVKGGQLIEDSTPFKESNYNPDNKKSTVCGNTLEENENVLEGVMTHSSKNKVVKFVIEYIDANHIKLVKVFNTPGVKISTPDAPYDSSISLPQNIILTKQK